MTNFFGRKRQENSLPLRSIGQLQNPLSQPTNSTATVSLIDLSPPGSPTFTTRSSSDGVSVDSFGSDGNSNPSVFTSSGSTSQTESAFEDDFDFFGLSAKKAFAPNDPWQVKTAQDPFGPLEDVCSNVSQRVSDTCFPALNSNNRVTNQVPSSQSVSKPLVTSMPTIIRARPPKPPAPKMLPKKLELATKATRTDLKVLSNAANKSVALDLISNSGAMNGAFTLDFSNAWPNDYGEDNPSPPMPSIPPPALPAGYLTELNSNLEVSVRENSQRLKLIEKARIEFRFWNCRRLKKKICRETRTNLMVSLCTTSQRRIRTIYL